jgi:hypothetical protein
MARYGELLGFSVARALWRFGFVTGSDTALAFGVCTARPLYVVCWHTGRVVETMLLAWGDPLPARFAHVVEARIGAAPVLRLA